MRTAGRIAESRILTKNRLSGQNARTACFFLLLTPPGTGIPPSFPDGFRPRSPGKARTSSRGNPPRTLPVVSVTVVHVGVLTSASAADSSSKIIISREISFFMGSSKDGSFGERGYLVATMKGYTICDMGAIRTFLLARHFLVTGGRIRCEGKRKAPILSNRC